ncbi:putative dTDP-4-dehydrorhamnose 3,5-epimerase [Burkholderia pseudomallei MSHR5492]|nr:putative dTDP-4-dehydrorhamnose 3,5-epimerase [Burkholderia pseudomallei MSHR5492]KOS80907.1 dTDP-4-dehydrorhamnose 3,5-epimerase [Burkholderia mallei]KOS98499.1 dTDP-4-dehydrorhamnose 3,5-epimerase [Burkholderia mallei]
MLENLQNSLSRASNSFRTITPDPPVACFAACTIKFSTRKGNSCV